MGCSLCDRLYSALRGVDGGVGFFATLMSSFLLPRARVFGEPLLDDLALGQQRGLVEGVVDWIRRRCGPVAPATRPASSDAFRTCSPTGLSACTHRVAVRPEALFLRGSEIEFLDQAAVAPVRRRIRPGEPRPQDTGSHAPKPMIARNDDLADAPAESKSGALGFDTT